MELGYTDPTILHILGARDRSSPARRFQKWGGSKSLGDHAMKGRNALGEDAMSNRMPL